MKNLTRLIVSVLAMQLSFGSLSTAVAAEKTAPSATNVAYRSALVSLRDMVAKNPENFLDPSEIEASATVADKATMLEANQRLLAKVNDNSYTIAEIRGELLKRINEEEAIQILEIRAMLNRMKDSDVEKLASEAFAKGRYDPSLKMKYETAYLLNEKKEAVFDLLIADLANAKSDAVKRLGIMDRKSLAKELSGTAALLNTKGDGWKIALIIILSVAAAGLISFGIVSASKARHERKMKELEKEYEGKTAKEIADHEAAIAEMKKKHLENIDNTNAEWVRKTAELEALFAQRAALREGGYTWQVCRTTNTPKTVSCPYDGRTYVGTETCTSYCLKNNSGQEFGMSQLICSSAQIPWECNKPNAYGTGYSAGGTKGYDDGYNTGYDSEYARAYDNAYQDYYEIAYDEGYSSGYQYGFDEGYSDGLAAGQYEGYNEGYDEGYDIGYSAGYTYGQQVAAGG